MDATLAKVRRGGDRLAHGLEDGLSRCLVDLRIKYAFFPVLVFLARARATPRSPIIFASTTVKALCETDSAATMRSPAVAFKKMGLEARSSSGTSAVMKSSRGPSDAPA